MELKEIIRAQKEFFHKGDTLKIEERIGILKNLKSIIKVNEEKILNALQKDLGKAHFEGYVSEIGMVYEEINTMIKNLRKWSKRERVKSSIKYFPSKSYIYNEPYGTVLIIGPFNYPFALIFSPLVGAIAAGNTVVIKPSEHSYHTSKIIEEIINNNFKEELIKVVNPLGGKEVVEELLELSFDYIFFTGSRKVGSIIMKKASEKLIPVTLELGGKSPCIVDKDCNISLSAKRIVWGKFLNGGQTCVAPDYLYVHKDIKEEFLKAFIYEIKKQFGEDPKENKDYPKIINKREVERICGLIKDGDIYYGGEVDKEKGYISPTVLVNIKENSNIIYEEIFGPVFPTFEFGSLDKVISEINRMDKPLALYYFSEDKNKIDYILERTYSGGVTINDTIIHVASTTLPFGGVGSSGMGSYHGKYSYETFSHRKSVVVRGTFMELPIRFGPYNNKLNLIKKIMK